MKELRTAYDHAKGMETGSDPAANLQEMQRSEDHVELYNEDAIDKIQTLWNSMSQAAQVLQTEKLQGKERDGVGNLCIKRGLKDKLSFLKIGWIKL